MKKFISAFIALAMIATTFVSTAFAAGTLNVAFSVDADSYKVGDTVTCTASLSGDTFASCSLRLDYDMTVLSFVKASKSASLAGNLGYNDAGSIASASFAADDNIDMSQPHTITYTFKVLDTAAAGTYDIKLLTGANTYAYDIDDDDVAVSGNVTTVKIVSDEPAEATAAFDKDAATKYEYDTVYNYGVGGTVTVPEGKSTTGVTFDISNGTDTYNYNFDFGTSIAANTSFGLNIGNVPKDVTLTFSNLKVK